MGKNRLFLHQFIIKMTSNIEELKSKFEQEVEKMRQLEKGLIFKCLDFSICLSKFAEILDRLKCMV